MQTHACDARDQPIGDAGGDFSEHQAVLPPATPALEEIEIPRQKLVHHAGDVPGIILKVAVQGCNQVTPGGVEAGLHRGGLTEVTAQPQDAHMIPIACGALAQALAGAVPAPIVDADQLPGPFVILQPLMDPSKHRGHVVRLLVHGDDDGEAVCSGRAACHPEEAPPRRSRGYERAAKPNPRSWFLQARWAVAAPAAERPSPPAEGSRRAERDADSPPRPGPPGG